MPIKTGFVTQLDMDIPESIQRAGDMGFDYVEIMMDGPGERTRLAAQSEELTAALDEQDMGLVVHLPFKLDIGSPLQHVRDGAIKEIKAAIDTAASLGAHKGVLHASANAWGPAWDIEQIQSLIIAAVDDIDAYGKEQDLTICVENIPSEFFDIHDFPYLFEQTEAAMTLDTGHARISGMESAEMAAFIGEFNDRIEHLHLNDTRTPSDEHLPFGAGNLDFEQILAPVIKRGTATVSLEVFTDDWDYMQKSKDRLDALL